jgi:hypothetical protein
MYSNRRSLELTYGKEMVEGLVKEEDALTKAINEAASMIDGVLGTAGYLLPLPAFSLIGEEVVPPAELDPPLNPMVGRISDALTIWLLSSDTDTNRQKWEDDAKFWMDFLGKVRTDDFRLVIEGTEDVSGAGQAVVHSRSRVFTGATSPLNPYLLRRLP